MPKLAPLSDILEHRQTVEASLKLYYSASNPGYLARFALYLPSEVSAELKERLEEAERQSSLVMLARVEAAFRVDYKSRGSSKSADPISSELRKIYSEDKERARLDDILSKWKEHLDPKDRHYISTLRDMLHYRHWLAHGRHWNRGTAYDFDDIYILANAIITGFGLQT